MELVKDDNISNFSARQILLKGSLIALILTGSSLSSLAITWYILDDLMLALIISGVVYFVAMIFSIKILKRFFPNDSKSKVS